MTMMKVIDMQELRQKHEDPLGLRSLPLARPAEDGWPVIESALLEKNRKSRGLRLAGGGLAVAAAVLLAVVLVPSLRYSGDAPVEHGVAVTPATQETESAPLKEPALESLIAMSQQLENRVRLYRDRFGDLPAEALVYQVELQDLIVQVDDELSVNPESTELWGQRVNLLLDVTRLYENSLRRDYHRMASL